MASTGGRVYVKMVSIGAGRRTRLLGLRVGFLFGGVAYGSKLSRRRLATSRDMGWKMASPTDGKNRLETFCLPHPSALCWELPFPSATRIYISFVGSSPFPSTSFLSDVAAS